MPCYITLPKIIMFSLYRLNPLLRLWLNMSQLMKYTLCNNYEAWGRGHNNSIVMTQYATVSHCAEWVLLWVMALYGYCCESLCFMGYSWVIMLYGYCCDMTLYGYCCESLCVMGTSESWHHMGAGVSQYSSWVLLWVMMLCGHCYESDHCGCCCESSEFIY